MGPVARHMRQEPPATPQAVPREASAEDKQEAQDHNLQVLHPDAEGKPWCLWLIFILLVISTVLAAVGHTLLGTLLIALTSLCSGGLRLVLRERSPWKVRSVAFDSIISIGLGLGLMLTYLSIQMLL